MVVLSEAEKQRLEQLLAQDEEDDTETEVRDQPLYHSPTLTDIHVLQLQWVYIVLYSVIPTLMGILLQWVPSVGTTNI